MVIGGLVAGALHQARTHRRLAARERAHERFAEQVIAAQETERRRLAGDIHDGISQRLVTLSYHLDAAGHALRDDRPTPSSSRLARGLVDLTLDEARAAIGGLRPPVLDDLGLAGGLASLARSVPGWTWASTSPTTGCPSTSRSRCTGSRRRRCRTSSSTPGPERAAALHASAGPAQLESPTTAWGRTSSRRRPGARLRHAVDDGAGRAGGRDPAGHVGGGAGHDGDGDGAAARHT